MHRSSCVKLLFLARYDQNSAVSVTDNVLANATEHSAFHLANASATNNDLVGPLVVSDRADCLTGVGVRLSSNLVPQLKHMEKGRYFIIVTKPI